jgi:hypothetical protein
MATTALPQISSYAPVELVPTYILVMDEFHWAIGLWVDFFTDEIGTGWNEIQPMEQGWIEDVELIAAREDICHKLPRRMTMIEAVKYLKAVGII